MSALTSLRHRLPVRLRQHWRPVALLAASLTVLLAFFGDVRIIPYVTSAAAESDETAITENVAGTVDLYDDSAEHTLQLEYDVDDFDRMMKKFQEDGEKDWIEADLTVDGTYLNSVGIRLKGNSTLRSLRGDGGGRGAAAPDGAEAEARGAGGAGSAGGAGGAGGGLPGGASRQGQDAPAAEADGEGDQAQRRRVGPDGRGGMVSLSADKPEELPWLISVDKYVEGRAYQGHQEISLRPGSNAEVPLNEAVTLSLMDASEQPAERFAFSSLKVNNRPAATRLMVENPGADYARNTVGDNGVLYKALSTGSFTYKGDDQTDYKEDFKQLTMEGSQDVQPVVDLIEWVETASDEEFEKELSDHVDVESFARYVATQNLLLNFDDMSGPGKNYYLWYDLSAKKFTILGWDFNLTLSGDAEQGPDEAGGMLGGGGGGGAPAGAGEPPAGAGRAPEGARTRGTADEGDEGTADQDPADRAAPNEGNQNEADPNRTGPNQAEGEGRRRGGMSGHRLKERFLELDAFDDVRHEAYRELYETYYASGRAGKALDTAVARAEAAGADPDDLAAKAETLRSTITARTKSLASDEVITG
ncbi:MULTISPECIES: CotH kinase family protein [unclassified Streptomyces]|uniref:CotH kinase family protein n=1 Tax=unclassified Streptomyces TaxID=2593676 RepID=UPI000BF51467|nr:CotH kinase family protein [Streptomyces sp. Ru87]PGH49179.1 spore coat protein CotH [Streptomyces sp. Ru87]